MAFILSLFCFFMHTAQARDLLSGIALEASEFVYTGSCANPNSPSPVPQDCKLPATGVESQTQSLIAQVKTASLREIELDEHNFFYNFSKDQIKQSKCELKVLDQVDQLPQIEDAPSKISPEESIARALSNVQNSANISENVKARGTQEEILEDIWKKLEDIEAKNKEVAKAKKAIPEDPSSTANHGDPLFFSKWAAYDAGNKYWETLKAERDKIYNSVWNGADPSMRSFVDHALKRRKSGVKEDQFLRDGLEAIDTAHPENSLQKSVIEPLRRKAKDRICTIATYSSDLYEKNMFDDGSKKGYCGKYVSAANAGWSKDPVKQTNAERARKRLLLENDGVEDYIARTSPYKEHEKELTCVLEGKYKDGPQLLYLAGEGLTIAASIATGAYLARLADLGELEKLAKVVQFLVKNRGRAVNVIGALSQVPKLVTEDCAGIYDEAVGKGGTSFARSIQTKDVCALAEENIDAALIHKELQKGNCGTGLLLTAISAGASGLSNDSKSLTFFKKTEDLETKANLKPIVQNARFAKKVGTNLDENSLRVNRARQIASVNKLSTENLRPVTPKELISLRTRVLSRQTEAIANRQQIFDAQDDITDLKAVLEKARKSNQASKIKDYETRLQQAEAQLADAKSQYAIQADHTKDLFVKSESAALDAEVSANRGKYYDVVEEFDSGKGANEISGYKNSPHDTRVKAYRVKITKEMEVCRSYSHDTQLRDFVEPCPQVNFLSSELRNAIQATPEKNKHTHYVKLILKPGDELLLSAIGPQFGLDGKAVDYGLSNLGGGLQFQKLSKISGRFAETDIVRDVRTPQSALTPDILKFQQKFRASQTVEEVAQAQSEQERLAVLLSAKQKVTDLELKNLVPPAKTNDEYWNLKSLRQFQKHEDNLKEELANLKRDQQIVSDEVKEYSLRAQYKAQGMSDEQAYREANKKIRSQWSAND